MHKLIIQHLLFLIILHTTLTARDININQRVEQAKNEQKQVFVFLHRTDCNYCESMIIFTLDDDSIRPILEEDFFLIDININHDDNVLYKEFSGSGREFATYVGYNFYPSSIFLDDNKKIIYGTIGYEDEKKFLITLKYIKDKAYETIDFESFQEMISKKE